MNTIILFLLKLFNLSPLFSVSSDELFGSIALNTTKRYSLVRVSFGFTKFYIISIKNRKFSFIKTLNLNSLRPWPLQNTIEDKTNAYDQFIQNKTNDELAILSHYLEKKIDIESNAKSSLNNKVSIYNAIFLIIIGYAIHLFTTITKNWQNDFHSYLLILILFFVFMSFSNCMLFIYNYSKNKMVFRSKFSDIKSNPTPQKLSVSLYCDWYSTKGEREILATYVLNIEKYIFKTVILVIILSTTNLFPIYKTIFEYIPTGSKPYVESISLIDSSGNFNNEKLKAFSKLISNMTTSNISTIYIIKSNLTKNKSKYKQTLNTINLFSNNIEIKELAITDYPKNQELLIIKPIK